MTHPSQHLSFPSAVTPNQSPPHLLPTKPPQRRIPLRAAWASLTLPQQQRLLQQLVQICCELLRPRPLDSGKEDAHDAE